MSSGSFCATSRAAKGTARAWRLESYLRSAGTRSGENSSSAFHPRVNHVDPVGRDAVPLDRRGEVLARHREASRRGCRSAWSRSARNPIGPPPRRGAAGRPWAACAGTRGPAADRSRGASSSGAGSRAPHASDEIEDEARHVASAGIKSGSAQPPRRRARSRQPRFGDGCVVISDGAKRSRSSQRNQSIVPLSAPP